MDKFGLIKTAVDFNTIKAPVDTVSISGFMQDTQWLNLKQMVGHPEAVKTPDVCGLMGNVKQCGLIQDTQWLRSEQKVGYLQPVETVDRCGLMEAITIESAVKNFIQYGLMQDTMCSLSQDTQFRSLE